MWFLLLRQTLIRGEFDKMKGISEKTLIKIKDLKASVKLNNGDMLTTVTNANMELQRGRSYAIVGKSGSGKTSLISIIGLLNREYEGEYLYDGISISALKDRDLSILRANNIGFVFQNYSLIKHLRVWENIELPLLYAKKSFTAKQRHEIITGLLKSVGLESKENDYPINLSGGEQQRVAIARALAVSPEAILCDEPTGALDKKTGTQIMELLHSVVKEKGIMLLLVTHDPDIADASTLADLDSIVVADYGAISLTKPGSSVAQIKEKEYFLHNLFAAMLVPSGNDAAYVVADYCGGLLSPQAESCQERVRIFMENLNLHLQQQGYLDTVLYDPSGFDMEALTTTLDLKEVVYRLLEYSWFREIVSQNTYTATLPDGSTQIWQNTNAFLDPTSEYYNENVCGIKTGSLSDDYNLIVLYQQHGKEFLICSLGSQSDSSRYDDVNFILKTINESYYLTQ